MRRYDCTALLCLVSLVATACSDQSSAPCSAVAVSVSEGIQPSFSWEPACPVQSLVVRRPGPGPVIWATIASGQSNSIAPSVTYGVFPPGAALTANILLPLEAGRTYEVVLSRLDESAVGPPQQIGSATFVP
jgi:hypothetical protein